MKEEIKLVKLASGEELICLHHQLGKLHTLKNPSYVVRIEDTGDGIPFDISPYCPLSEYDDIHNRVFEIDNQHVMHVTKPFKGPEIMFRATFMPETLQEPASNSPIYTPDNVIAMPSNETIYTGI